MHRLKAAAVITLVPLLLGVLAAPVAHGSSWYLYWLQKQKVAPSLPPEEPGNLPAQPGDPPATPDEPPSYGLTQDEARMISLINRDRQKRGLSPLETDMRLVRAARKKSQDIVDNGYFSHTSPVHGTIASMLWAEGIKYGKAGENLSASPTPERAHMYLMVSRGHRANILDPSFTHVGVGIAHHPSWGLVITEIFCMF